MKLGILISVLIFEFLMVIVVGLVITARERRYSVAGAADFALGGRSMGVIPLACTMALAVLGSGHLIGNMENAFENGHVAILFITAHAALLIVACFFTGNWARKLQISTIPELFEMLYSKEIRMLVAGVIVMYTWPIVSLELQCLGILFNMVTGWSIITGAVLGLIVAVVYGIMAGMKQIAVVNTINVVIIYAAMILAVVYVARYLGGNYDPVINYYEEIGEAADKLTYVWGDGTKILTYGVSCAFAAIFCQGTGQILLQPCMSAKSAKTVRNAAWIAAPINGMFGVFAVTLAMTSKTIPEFAELGAKLGPVHMIVNIVPNWVVFLFLAGGLAVILSSASMVMLAISTLYTEEIHCKYIQKNLTSKQITRLQRALMIVAGLMGLAIVPFLPAINNAVNWLFAWVAPVFWLFVTGVLWKRHNGCAYAVLLLCWFLCFLWSFTPLPSMMGSFVTDYITINHVTGIFSPIFLLISLSCVKKNVKPGYFKSEAYLAKKAARKNVGMKVTEDTADAE